jgi:hypothetical protein
MWNEAVLVQSAVLFQHLPERAEQNHVDVNEKSNFCTCEYACSSVQHGVYTVVQCETVRAGLCGQ